jgi:two-component system, OmpR family, response regulator RegX3
LVLGLSDHGHGLRANPDNRPSDRAGPPTLHERMAGRRTILMVEDETSITEPLAEALDREGFATRVAGTVADALSAAEEEMPDLVLLDVMLPDGSGYDVARSLRERSKVPIIMLTARGEETDRIVGLELGADDYIVKPFSAREVAARIRAVLRRAGDAGGEVVAQSAAATAPVGPLEIGPVRLEHARREASLEGAPLDLTRKEFELLELLMSEAGNVITRERLIDEVWDTNWYGSTKTLDVHVSSLRRKLGDDSQNQRFIHTVRGVGFRFASADEL